MEKGLKVLSKRKKVLGDKVGEVELLALKFKKTKLIKLRYNKKKILSIGIWYPKRKEEEKHSKAVKAYSP